MHKRRNWFEGVLIFLLLLLAVSGFAVPSHSSPVAAVRAVHGAVTKCFAI